MCPALYDPLCAFCVDFVISEEDSRRFLYPYIPTVPIYALPVLCIGYADKLVVKVILIFFDVAGSAYIESSILIITYIVSLKAYFKSLSLYYQIFFLFKCLIKVMT